MTDPASGGRGRRLVVHIPRRYTDRSWGGTERVLEKTLPLLRQRDFEASIFTSQALDERPLGQVAGTPISRFRYFYPEWPLSSERKLDFDHKGGNTLSPALARAISEVRDLSVVHCHTGNLLGAQCLRVARKRGVPVVLTLHGGHFAIPPGERQELSHKGNERKRRGLPLGRLASLALDSRRLLQNVDALICVGLDEFEAARAALPGRKVVFLPGGVDIDEFDRADRARGRELLGVAEGRALVVCVARVDRQKDQLTLVRAWAQHCGIDCDLALIGPETSAGYSESLRNAAQGAPGRLILPGGIAPSDAPHVYAAGDVSVLPSVHEPFGLTVLESWAAGTPLVCSDVGGPGWLLRDENFGRLFPVGDAAALGTILRDLLRDADQRRILAEAARAHVKTEFTWTRRANRLADLYEELLAGPRAQR